MSTKLRQLQGIGPRYVDGVQGQRRRTRGRHPAPLVAAVLLACASSSSPPDGTAYASCESPRAVEFYFTQPVLPAPVGDPLVSWARNRWAWLGEPTAVRSGHLERLRIAEVRQSVFTESDFGSWADPDLVLAVEFHFTEEGALRYHELERTLRAESEDPVHARGLAILMDDTLFSAPFVSYVPEFDPAEKFVRQIEFPDTEPRDLVDFIAIKAGCSRME